MLGSVDVQVVRGLSQLLYLDQKAYHGQMLPFWDPLLSRAAADEPSLVT